MTDTPILASPQPVPDSAARPKRSWRDFYKVHEAADLFPMMSRNELFELGQDIKRNGGKPWQDITLWRRRNGKLLMFDGRNRLDAMEMMGYDTVDEDGKLCVLYRTVDEKIGINPYRYLFSYNFRRRHLTSEQIDEVIRRVTAKAQSTP